MSNLHKNLNYMNALTGNSPAHVLASGDWQGVPSAAIYSPCKLYRYILTRVWDPKRPTWMFAMLNPSKATENDGDNTVDRQFERARRGNAGAIVIVNAGALRETRRKIAIKHHYPANVENDNKFWIERFASCAEQIIVAHGPDAAKFGGERLLRSALGAHAFQSLHVTKNGSPGHPLYVPYGKAPVPHTYPAS